MTSGQLEVFGLVENWDDIKSYLFSIDPISKPPVKLDSEQRDDSWNNDWGWAEDEGSSSTKQNIKVKEDVKDVGTTDVKKKVVSWPQNCVIAHSPMGTVFVVAKNSKAIFFTSEWDLRNSRMKFLKSFQGELSQEDGETITSAICIPLVSKKLSSPGAPDWTCILIGFSTGQVRMYTENGNNLVNQMFHNQRVVSFKIRSYQPANNSTDHDQLEEIFVLYETVIVTMDGFGLFQTLRACRNHLARLQANATETSIDPPPLSYKKWQYENERAVVSDCDSIGLKTPSTFAHLVTASILGGFHAKCKPVPLTSYIFVSTGKKPYVTFNYAQEGQAVPVLTEIAYAMASKLKSSLLSAASGWLGFGGTSTKAASAPPKEKPVPVIEPATSMSNRFGIVDNGRVGQTVSVSPCRKLTAVTDTLGRVVLFDNNLGLVVRMWKGYREAQVGWLQVTEEVSHGRSTHKHTHHSSRHKQVYGREALFIVIYAPRRGHLEVYAMQQGPKVATFNVVRNGRLVSTSWGMMGLNNIPLKGGNKPLVPCLFIDSEAQLFTLNIPFHMALCDKTRSKAKDIHLLKTLQKLLKDKQEHQDEISAEEILDLLKQVQVQSMINQGFKILSQKLAQTKVFREVLEKYSELFCDDEEKDLSVLFRLQSLLDLYTFLLETSHKPPEYIEPIQGCKVGENDEIESEEHTILRCLHSTSKEIKVLQDMGVKHNSRNQEKSQSSKNPNLKMKSVKFQDEEDTTPRQKDFPSLPAFFSALTIDFDVHKLKAAILTPVTAGNSSSLSHGPAEKPLEKDRHIKFNPKSEYSSSLGLLLFSGVLNNPSDLEEWKNRIRSSGLIPMEILLLALSFWSEAALLSSSYVTCMKQLYHVLIALCQLDPQSVTIEFSRVSKWWEDIRKEIAKSCRIFHIYSFAIVCRAVAIDLQNLAELKARESGEKKKSKKVSSPDTTETEGGSGAVSTSTEGAEEVVDGTSEKMSTSSGEWDNMEEWENISLDLIKWNLLLKQIEDLSLLSIILIQKPVLKETEQVLPLLPNEIAELSVLNLLDKGKGCIAELVGKWLSTIGIDPSLIPDPDDSDNPTGGPDRSPPPSPEPKGKPRKRLKVTDLEEDNIGKQSQENAEEVKEETGSEAVEIEPDSHTSVAYVKDLLKCLKQNFSVSLSTSIIIANYCWEYCLEWNKDTNEIHYLSAAIQCVNAIPGPHIKQGMMSMMWSTFLDKKFALSASTGGHGTGASSMNFLKQKDHFKLTDKPSGFNSYEIEEAFLLNLVNFFDYFMEVNVMCEGLCSQKGYSGRPSASSSKNALAKIAKDKNHWSNDAASASLTDLAVIQAPANYQMLLLHYQLALVAHFLHKFRIRKQSMKPTMLFDTKSRMMFFQDFSAQAPFSNVEVDLALKVLREEFLVIVIRHAIHEIPEEFSTDDDDLENDSEFKKMIQPSLGGVRECENWTRKCYDLGRIWGLDLDNIRITQVCELYSSGFDLLGLEMISSVNAKDVLGSKLLVVAGMRINFIIETNDTANVTEIVSSLSTNLSNWLKNLNYSRLRCLRFTKESIAELAQELLQLIPDSNYDYKLAEELLLSSNFL